MHERQGRSRCRAIAVAALSLAASATLAQAPPAPFEGSAPAAPGAAPPGAQAADESSGYAIGLVFGSQLHNSGLDNTLPSDAVMRGFRDGMGGKLLDDENKQRAAQLMRTGRALVAERNRATARDFLAQNAAVKDVVTTASGLQYHVFEAGEAKAASPASGDQVTVHYRGWLLDGTEFDSSGKPAQSVTLGLEGLIKGWREGLLLMKPGAKWRLFIPPELAYDVDSPAGIPPGSLLVYDVELLKVASRASTK